ncbi:transcriptional regulator [Bacillus pseudomycoides]|uniref:helix-turn-helix transcriptional regulator n=1 Tax=Bacillus pseudomycoides TaxID=64104 RepID=UPI00031A3404|nr:helix-turn-helix transcriptional regulator [Bacillus pseudomycoides]PEJ23953.1 transcriptional regulator [Bacillus pseudomycoides]PGC37640.1 transcriptional regulator [Bacillus pseudomycoides]PHG26703.1 transcriptional regulator [Bacillus pseudomycoides]
MAFTTKIKEYHTHSHMTQDDLAKLIGVRRETISHLEKRKYNPSLQSAYDIAKALNASIEEIFIFDEV